MRERRGLSRWEVLLGLLLFSVTVAYAKPRFETFQRQTRRSELSMVLESLRAAQLAHHRANQDWFDLPASPRGPGSVGTNAVPWGGVQGWTPPLPELRGSYRTERGAAGITLIGECDIDGDGVRAVYEATPKHLPHRVTPDDVY